MLNLQLGHDIVQGLEILALGTLLLNKKWLSDRTFTF